ncbi:50S ribosomal protein L24 [Candidatus Woesearchaeota archaeon]|nr:50S ribosomal protein L24 [Candidatus Woesearchaeota archaeon]
MKKKYSPKWIKSTQVRKQRKYRYNAPLHIRNKFMGATLSKELKDKHKRKTLPIRVGDRVRVLRGKFRKNDAKVERLDVKRNKVYLEKIRLTKKDGSEVAVALRSSNLMIISLNMDDKLRLKGRKTAEKKKKLQTSEETKEKDKEKLKSEVK